MRSYVYDDLLVGDLNKDVWFEFMTDDNPSNRFALSAVLWKDEIVIYGGVMERHASDMYAIKVSGLATARKMSGWVKPDFKYCGLDGCRGCWSMGSP